MTLIEAHIICKFVYLCCNITTCLMYRSYEGEKLGIASKAEEIYNDMLRRRNGRDQADSTRDSFFRPLVGDCRKRKE